MVTYENLPSYLAMCDAFITASVTEVHPLSVIEGMASGLPVMGISSPGVSDTVEDGVTGFIATEDLAAFTAKLTRLCLDTSLAQTNGRCGPAGIHSTMPSSGPRRSCCEHYERLVSGTRPRREKWEVRLRGLLEKYLQ